MSKEVSQAHHNLYEYAQAIQETVKVTEDSTIEVDKELLSQLSVAYMHLYTDVYINQRIRPVKALLPKEFIQ